MVRLKSLFGPFVVPSKGAQSLLLKCVCYIYLNLFGLEEKREKEGLTSFATTHDSLRAIPS